MWVDNISIFVLSVVQAAKIFGMAGVPGTQALGAIFIAAYTVPEILRAIFGATHTAADPPAMDLRFETMKYCLYPIELALCFAACLVHCALGLWIVSRSLPADLLVFVSKRNEITEGFRTQERSMSNISPTPFATWSLQVLVQQSYLIFVSFGYVVATLPPV
jgi:hypothetical protein